MTNPLGQHQTRYVIGRITRRQLTTTTFTCRNLSTITTGTKQGDSSQVADVVQPKAPIFNRREKKKLLNLFPRPDRLTQSLYPALPTSFVNRITMADGSSYYMTTRSPRNSITLARDVTNHPLWNPSLAREVADQDQSGRMGRFERRYGGNNKINGINNDNMDVDMDVVKKEGEKKENEQVKSAFGLEDLSWIEGHSHLSTFGTGNAKNIKGLKKSSSSSPASSSSKK